MEMKFVDRSEVFKHTSRRRKSSYNKTEQNPSEVYDKVNEKFGITEMFLVDYTPISDIKIGDPVFTSYHGNKVMKVESVEKNNIAINDIATKHLKEGQFIKKED